MVGIRLVDASPADAAAVGAQLGPLESPLERDPDIVIRFVDRLVTTSPVLYLGLDDAGFTDDAFLLLRSKHKSRARVQIPLAQVGERCEIVCERGVPAVPLLIPIVNLTALAKGIVPLHASAFVYQGTGVVVTGWTKGGKTEALLAFMARGARYVADEWVYLLDRDRVGGIPEPIRLWDWQLRQLEEHRAALASRDRRRLRALTAFTKGASALRKLGLRSGALDRAVHLGARQMHADVSPAQLFSQDAVALSGPFDRLFFVSSHERDEIDVRPVDAAEVARRMVFSLQHERLDLREAYLKFRFAFPDKENPLIERAEQLQRDGLTRLLAGKPAFAVDHPYPLSLAALYDAMSPHC